jgi:hypothetical protein
MRAHSFTAGSFSARVRPFNPAFLPGEIPPNEFYVRVLSGSPMPEMEPNDEGAPQAPRSSDWGVV